MKNGQVIPQKIFNCPQITQIPQIEKLVWGAGYVVREVGWL